MKNAVLILLLILLPWQAVFAAERNVTHLMGSGHGPAFVFVHLDEHAGHVLHHHDDDDNVAAGTTHVDASQKSVQHLADFEHGTSMFTVLGDLRLPGLPVAERIAPSLPSDAFSDRTTSPLLRPPRAFA